jgi:nitroreductase
LFDCRELQMDLVEAVRGRRSVREYTDKTVGRDEIRFVIEAATQAPSAMNRQGWTFAVTTDRERMKRWSDRAKVLMLEAITGQSKLEALREHLTSPTFNIFYNAPVLIVIATDATDSMAAQDCCLAGQNLMLAAFSRGLGTCWIGLAQAWLARAEAKQELGLPAGCQAVAAVILGYPRQAPVPVPREPARIHWIG